MYIPCGGVPAQAVTNVGPSGVNAKVGINNWSDAVNFLFPYNVHGRYTIWVSDYGGANHGVDASPFFRITTVDPANPTDPQTSSERGVSLVYHAFKDGIKTGEFVIPANFGALVEMYSGEWDNLIWQYRGFNCWFEVTYQNETVSPPPPALKPLPPETYGTSVTLSWTAPLDEVNPDAPSGTPASGIAKYYVQYSTDPLFAANTVTVDTGTPDTSHIVTGLTLDSTYYFRVRADRKSVV